jgi:CheY-specific phosphatase CheX
MELEAITRDVLALVFAVEPETGTSPHGDTLAARVRINGAWEGSIVVRTVPELARELAASMFGRPGASLQQDEVLDGLGEVGNMIAGNVKGLLTDEARLSLPVVSPWRGPEEPRGGTLRASIEFAIQGLPMQVMLISTP